MSGAGIARRDFLLAGAASLLPRPANASGPARSSIRILLTGGPSQLDTFDPKPDAPTDIRGPFRPIRTSVPGIFISELFPLTARQAHRIALIRSVYPDGEPVHQHCREFAPLSDLSREPEAVHARYGRDRFGQACLAACRAVEAGERSVTVSMFESAMDGATWDAHGWGPFSTVASLRDSVAPVFDRAYSALLEDLASRGLLATTVVWAMGEFGRTPKLNPEGGRDHWPHCRTALLAGGGIGGGQILGSSDAIGAEPRDNPVTPGAIAAAVRRLTAL